MGQLLQPQPQEDVPCLRLRTRPVRMPPVTNNRRTMTQMVPPFAVSQDNMFIPPLPIGPFGDYAAWTFPAD